MSHSDETLPVLDSVVEVVSLAGGVFFQPEMIEPAVERWGHLLDAAQGWEHPCHFFDGTRETVRWIFALDVLNHCFWPDPGDPVWTVAYRGEQWSGYFALAACLKRAVEWGYPVTDPAWLAKVSGEDLEHIFSPHLPAPPAGGVEKTVAEPAGGGGAGTGRIPLFDQRLQNLREAGSVIITELGGDIVSLFERASGSAVRLVRDVVSHFPSFRDEALYRGRKVYFWKRAQIFAADVFAAFGGKGWGGFNDIGRLTAFADYKLPQVLRELGIIVYNAQLAARIDSLKYLEPGSEPEVEIRAMTVYAVEQLRKAFDLKRDRAAGISSHEICSHEIPSHEGGFHGPPAKVTSAEVDGWLWRLGQGDEFRTRPYHRCRTIFY